jgi:cytochrome c553
MSHLLWVKTTEVIEMKMKKSVLNLLLSVIVSAPLTVTAADIAQGEKLAAKCIGCHAVNGTPSPVGKPISGKDTAFISDQLKVYKDGSIKNPIMNAQASQLSDDDIANLAAYYNSIQN